MHGLINVKIHKSIKWEIKHAFRILWKKALEKRLFEDVEILLNCNKTAIFLSGFGFTKM
jgi:hypothetical protein